MGPCHLVKLLQAHWALASVLLFILNELSGVWVAQGYTAENDANALRALQQEWQSPAMTSLRWTGNDPCGSKWKGVACESSRVTSIVLTGLGLPGVIPPDVGLLTALQTLDLSYNNLTGELPSQLGNLIDLSILVLQSNFFTGSIPAELGQLRNLKYLRLNNNNFRGPIPHKVGFLAKLYWLDLAFNNLDGPLPYSADGLDQVNAGLDNLTAARHFHLNNNSFSGSIPGAICHSSMTLIHLLLDSNQLSGTIPAEIGLCSELLIVKLNNNNLKGTIPSELGQLAKLTDLQLSENQLSGDLPDLSTLSQLQVLELANNSFHTYMPSWLTSLRSLTDLGMQNMIVTGAIPTGFFQLPYLTTVRLADNAINGTLNLSAASAQLSFVSLENNDISSITQGQRAPDIRLQGNPICESSSTLSSTVCSETSSTPTNYESSSCTTTVCPSGYMANPELDCSCAVPYNGLLTYRAPLFTTLKNSSRIPSLTSFIASALSISPKQIVIPSAYFNSQNYLVVSILIFPSSTARWSRDDIIRMSSILGQPDLSPDGFGPPLFKQDPYPYDVNASITKSDGLSASAKIGIALGALLLGLLLIAACIFAFWQKRRADRVKEISTSFAWSTSRPDSGAAPVMKGARRFSYEELKKATNNFSDSNNIGSGGYGKVYKGILPSGQQVAIKRAEQSSMQGATEFKNEIELLSVVHHKNVVGLVGFCFDRKEQMLVYEYIANGTLRDSISGHTGVKLDWQQRLKIALGAARGMMYLHELVSPPIIHRDIKSSNILLDEKGHAKVADFGLSKLGPREGSGKGHVSTQVKGTVGYLDPEYYLSEQLTEKSDVYSFGVVLLEMLTARPPIEHGKYVVREVKAVVDNGGLAALRPMLDPHIRHETLPELNDYVNIALSCVQDSGLDRPSMSQVVKRLEALIGDEYSASGSSNVVERGHPPQHPYASDSEFLHTSKGTSDTSFPTGATSTTGSR